MDYWAKPGLDRHQTLLLYPTLDESVSQDHTVCWTKSFADSTGRLGPKSITDTADSHPFRPGSWPE